MIFYQVTRSRFLICEPESTSVQREGIVFAVNEKGSNIFRSCWKKDNRRRLRFRERDVKKEKMALLKDVIFAT